jgi:IS1 family transposase
MALGLLILQRSTKKSKFYLTDNTVSTLTYIQIIGMPLVKVLPKDRHIVGKSHAVTIERNNSSTCHHLERMIRRTKIVSKKVEMIDVSMKLWCVLTTPETFQQY